MLTDIIYFFRLKPDFFESYLFSFRYFVLGFISLALCTLYFLFIRKIKSKNYSIKAKGILMHVFCLILLIVNVVYYVWQFLSSDIRTFLPLYHCRIVIIIFLIYYFSPSNLIAKTESIVNSAIFISIYGYFISLIFADVEKYAFPHFTNFIFYINHLLAFLLGILYIAMRKTKISFFSFIKTSIFMNLLNFMIIGVNFILNANYAYLLQAPFFKSLFVTLPLPLYTLLVLIAYESLLVIAYLVANFIFIILNSKSPLTLKKQSKI